MRKRVKKNNTLRTKIEKQELIAEVKTKSYESVRCYKVKYIGNDYNFIDLRYYQRGYDNKEKEVLFPTRKGVQIKEELFDKIITNYLDHLIKQKHK